MARINMTKMAKGSQENAKKIGVNKSFVDWLDTYGQISDNELIEQDNKGYDLIQVTRNSQHVRFEWEKR